MESTTYRVVLAPGVAVGDSVVDGLRARHEDRTVEAVHVVSEYGPDVRDVRASVSRVSRERLSRGFVEAQYRGYRVLVIDEDGRVVGDSRGTIWGTSGLDAVGILAGLSMGSAGYVTAGDMAAAGL